MEDIKSDFRKEMEERRRKHPIIQSMAETTFQECLKNKLSFSDVEVLCNIITSRAKKNPIC